MDSSRKTLLWLWELLIIVAGTFAAVEIPMRLVLHYPLSPGLILADWGLTLLFSSDLLLRWHSTPAMGQPVLLQKYQPLWRLTDVLAALPFHLLPLPGLTPLLRLLKLVRLAQLMYQGQHYYVQYANFLRLGFFVFWLALIAHWLACGWIALGGISGDYSPTLRYLRGLYWCITTLATVGYGDITPSTPAQLVYNMVVMILGVGMYGYVIGNVTSLLANIDLAKNHYRETMERLSAFMHYRRLPGHLQQRIRSYYAYLWDNRLGYDETAVLAELPTSLRVEVALFLRRDFIERAPLFQGASHELIREVALELRPVVFTPGDFVFRAGQFGRHMYFISRGTVEVLTADTGTQLATLSEGDFFGEIALLFSQPRTASIRALTYCDLYTLDKDTFDRILSHYSRFATHIRQMAQRRRGLEDDEGLPHN